MLLFEEVHKILKKSKIHITKRMELQGDGSDDAGVEITGQRRGKQ